MTDPIRYREAAARVHSYDPRDQHRSVLPEGIRPSLGRFEESHNEFKAEVDQLRQKVRAVFAPFEKDGGAGTPPSLATGPADV